VKGELLQGFWGMLTDSQSVGAELAALGKLWQTHETAFKNVVDLITLWDFVQQLS
jgi:hypothetical protein